MLVGGVNMTIHVTTTTCTLNTFWQQLALLKLHTILGTQLEQMNAVHIDLATISLTVPCVLIISVDVVFRTIHIRKHCCPIVTVTFSHVNAV